MKYLSTIPIVIFLIAGYVCFFWMFFIRDPANALPFLIWIVIATTVLVVVLQDIAQLKESKDER